MDKRIFIVIGGVVLLVGIIILFKIMMKPSDDCQKLIIDATPRILVIGSGEKIQFSDATPDATSWLWNFGDGKGTSTEQNPTYEFEQSGKYIVQLTVNGKCTDTLSITVKSFLMDTDKVVVNISAPIEGEVGTPIQFAGTADGAKKFYWKFGETTHIDDSTQNPKYTFKSPGTYNVFLKTDNANKPGELKITVYPKRVVVKNSPPPPPVEKKTNTTTSTPKTETKKTTPPPPPEESGLVTKAEIISHLQSIAGQDRMNVGDKMWVNQNFILGLGTITKVPGYSDVKTLNDLIDNMTINPGSVTIKSVDVVYDMKRKVVGILTVNISVSK